MRESNYTVVCEGNTLFVKAQDLHKKIMSCRKTFNYSKEFCGYCYTAATCYLNILMNALHCQAPATLPIAVLSMNQHSMYLESNSFANSCIIHSGVNTDFNMASDGIFHHVMSAYLSLRVEILEKLQEVYPAVYSESTQTYTHSVTGVTLKVDKLSAAYSLDDFYELY